MERFLLKTTNSVTKITYLSLGGISKIFFLHHFSVIFRPKINMLNTDSILRVKRWLNNSHIVSYAVADLNTYVVKKDVLT